MIGIARNHHTVAQCYLANFTDTGTREGRLWVRDLRSGKCFSAMPRNVAVVRDFNTISDERYGPDSVEKALSYLEGAAIRVIRRICAEQTLPPDDDFSCVLNLMALLVVHNPRMRRGMNCSMERSYRMIVDLLASDRSLYQSQLRKAYQAGYVKDPEFPFERFQKFVVARHYAFEVPTDANLGIEFRTFDGVLNLLGRRRWSLLVAADEAPDLITSDHPVAVVYKDPSIGGPIGFGLRNTEVTFPLNRRLALCGVFEDPLPPRFVVSPTVVEELNRRTISFADRQVFGRKPS